MNKARFELTRRVLRKVEAGELRRPAFLRNTETARLVCGTLDRGNDPLFDGAEAYGPFGTTARIGKWRIRQPSGVVMWYKGSIESRLGFKEGRYLP